MTSLCAFGIIDYRPLPLTVYPSLPSDRLIDPVDRRHVAMRVFALVIMAVATSLSLAFRPPPHLDKDILDALPFEAD
jgi:hypothetical protein